MRRLLLTASALAATLSAAAIIAPAAAQSIQNAPSYSIGDGPNGFGSIVPTVGQTFTAPTSAAYMTSFTFYLANDPDFGGGDELYFRAYLMTWNVDHPTGVNLLASSPVTQGNGGADFRAYTFDGGNAAVTPGDVYVAFLSTAGISQSGNGTNAFAGSTDANVGGQLVYAFTLADGSDLTSAQWWSDGADSQLGFAAEFTGAQSTVPEPSEFLLIATGLSSIAGTVRFRRRRQVAA